MTPDSLAKLEDQQEGGCTEYGAYLGPGTLNLKSGFLSRWWMHWRTSRRHRLATLVSSSSFQERYDGIIQPNTFGLGWNVELVDIPGTFFTLTCTSVQHFTSRGHCNSRVRVYFTRDAVYQSTQDGDDEEEMPLSWRQNAYEPRLMSTIYRVHQESVFIFKLKLSKGGCYALVIRILTWTTDEMMKRKKIGIFNGNFLPASR
ncbi:uncharacterized protein ARMOST_01567 [Armillaria ostoyae]|uniref:Uncharacterized protein n=1 Tax=Armillaria ostoyae TaxID=47428 RepID=A0A284QPB5_ARMOS|nr:uncharacterized protein ARMOST_01567 [Armillaria ostoyae]